MRMIRKIRCKHAYDMSDQELAYIVRMFYNAQLKYPRGLDRKMEGGYLETCISDILRVTGISRDMLRDVLMILFKRNVLLSEFDVSAMRITSVKAGSNALVFVQTTLQAKRDQRWTRWLAIAALLISAMALGAQVGEAFGWFTSQSELPAQPVQSPSQPRQDTDKPSGDTASIGARPIS